MQTRSLVTSRSLVGAFAAALPLTLLTACDRDLSDPPAPTTNERMDDTNRTPSTSPGTPLRPDQSPTTPGPSSGTGTSTQ